MQYQNSENRESFEDRYIAECKKIDSFNLTELQVYRKKLLTLKEKIEKEVKFIDTKQSRKDFIIGLKKHVILPSLNYSKKRIATINRVLYNNGASNFLKRFYIEAGNNLPLWQFQQICGKAINAIDIDSQTIEDVKAFLINCKESINDINGNQRKEKNNVTCSYNKSRN